jgi:hypothetical protein
MKKEKQCNLPKKRRSNVTIKQTTHKRGDYAHILLICHLLEVYKVLTTVVCGEVISAEY